LKRSTPVEDVDLEWAMGPQGRARQKIPKVTGLLNQRTDVRLVHVHHRVWVAGFPVDQGIGPLFALLGKDLRVRREEVVAAHGTAACLRRGDGATVCARLRVAAQHASCFWLERTRVRVYLSRFAGERRLKREWVEWKKISCGPSLDFAS
jgi:hypothetical protein